MLNKILSIFVFLASIVLADEIDLSKYEKSFYSQNGEDGVLSKIFQLIESSSRFCVEFGAYDGVTGSNTYLLRSQGWNCILFDRMSEIPEYNLYQEFITAENINSLFKKYNVPDNFELMSIDIDFNDFYVWKALDEKYKPAVVVIEYNSTLPPNEDKVVKYHPFFCGDGTTYFGASLLAMFKLGRAKGYSLVYVEKSGVNLFFIRDDILKETGLNFKNVNDVEKLYQPPNYANGPGGAHRQDYKKREYLSSGL